MVDLFSRLPSSTMRRDEMALTFWEKERAYSLFWAARPQELKHPTATE